MYSVLLLAALAQPPAPDPVPPAGMAPVQGLAAIDAKGKLTIWRVTPNCYGMGDQEVPLKSADKNDKEKAPAKAKVTTLMLTVVEMPAKHVTAYTVDGKAIASEKLAELLAKERTVLVALDGKKVDPFHLQLYKEGTIVLVPPASVFGTEFGPQFVPGVAEPPSLPVPPPPVKEVPPERKPEPKP